MGEGREGQPGHNVWLSLRTRGEESGEEGDEQTRKGNFLIELLNDQ